MKGDSFKVLYNYGCSHIIIWIRMMGCS